jgi:threonine synthase
MYPDEGISKIQKQQMVTCSSSNVKVVGVKGNFDDCQRIVKSLLNDGNVKKTILKTSSVTLNTANSINWGRIMPQILFHMVIFKC